MTYDHELILIKHIWKENEIGVQIPAEIKTAILCRIKSIGRNEFYDAAMTGLKPEIVFVIHEVEYSGQREVEFGGERYKVLRTYKGDMTTHGAKLAFDEMELICERIVASG